ncbi:MAG: TIGR01212 family radical SAM protein [Clostridiales bacterium]|nr:TIGR01212 family radical SAM protein [Clostridiales bacterium]
MTKDDWHGKPYYSLDAYCKNTYGEKLYKIALNAGLSCPNRDGTLGVGGCIFCSAGGSGDFAVRIGDDLSVSRQLAAGRALLRGKRTGRRYIAYFQAYTNTYGSPAYLKRIYEEALREPSVAGISIATRPDCLPENILTLLVNLKEKFPDKFVWIELGLQTIHEETARFIRRGYPLEVYDMCVARLRQADIPVITHIILGLPGETREHVLSTIAHLNDSGIQGIKLQLLHILKGTDLASLYQQGSYVPLTRQAYLELLIDCLEHLSPHIVVHRVTGDGPEDLLLAPLWSRNKRDVLNSLHHTMKLRAAFQGRKMM